MRRLVATCLSVAGAAMLALLPAGTRAIPVVDDIIEGVGDLANEIFEGIGAVPGLIWNAGRFYLSGPYGLVPALVEGKVVGELTKGLIKNRNLTPQEYAFAQSVFGDTLPPRDHIFITNLSGMAGRAFVSPDKILGGRYMMNLGVDVQQGSPRCPDQPLACRTGSYPTAGQLFVHEMVHVWQLYQASFQPGQAYKAIYTQIAEGSGAYGYTCGLSWDGYNPEQQAAIADRWFAGLGDNGICEYRYVVENLRKSRLTARHSASGGTAASVSRTPRDQQMWWIPWNGSVQTAWWLDEGRAQLTRETYELAAPGQAAVNGGVTAVSREPEQLDVFWIGADRSIQRATCRWPCKSRMAWRQSELSSAGSASQDGAITAVSRNRDHLEVWWTGAEGSVEAAYSYDAGASWARYQLAAPRSVAPSAGIAALSRIPSSLEVWWIAPDGSVRGSYFYDGRQWTPYALTGPDVASQVGGLTAVARTPQTMQVIFVGAKGAVKASKWREGDRHWTADDLAPAGSASLTSNLAAVSRMPATMEVWWASSDGALHDAFWFEDRKWQRFTLAAPGTTPQNGGITAVSRFPAAMEVWVSGRVILPRGVVHTVTSGRHWYEWSKWDAYDLVKQAGFNVAGTSRDQVELVRPVCSAATAGCAVTEASTLLLMLPPLP